MSCRLPGREGPVISDAELGGAGLWRRSRAGVGLGCCEEFVHDLGAGGDDGPQFAAVDDLGGAGGGVPGQAGDLLNADPAVLSRLTNVVRSSRGVQPSPIPASAQT